MRSASVDLLNNADFSLDSSGVAGFFGGEEAVSAMGTVHLYRKQKWLGWYNSPGSYTVAKQYGKLANNRFWDALFPGEDVEPAEFFGLDGKAGPEFIAWSSGNRLPTTGHIAYLIMKAAQSAKEIEVERKYELGNRSRPSRVTVVDLKTVEKLSSKPSPLGAPPSKLKSPDRISPELLRKTSYWAAGVTMFLSIAPCIACAVFEDWFCFAMILLGIFSNGLSCFVIGSGELQYKKPKPSPNSPPGDGILIAGPEVIILRGEESRVGAVITGKLKLEYAGGAERPFIGICSLFQYGQFLAQLLLIPQGTLFGQLMFLATFVASWVYNCYLSSRDKEKLQVELMTKALDNPEIQRFKLETRTTMVVFALLVLQPQDPAEFLDKLLPRGTDTWTNWRIKVLEQFKSGREFDFKIPKKPAPDADALLDDLLKDAETAYAAYKHPYFHILPWRRRAACHFAHS
ncbi:hypothetical protein BDZ94DRAFT_1280520 [Collybia nuda]|uniref:Uncharacterized protein n=1 Tax=Collybia nuda TaxID=64659 RepID=A0A9P5YC06_9AGAR|nr:hypothetical protein BDZ94DRAFT_1280520 [Collybia nuda]